MNRFYRAPLVFFLFKAAQQGLAPLVACSWGQDLSGFMMSLTHNYFVIVPYQPFTVDVVYAHTATLHSNKS